MPWASGSEVIATWNNLLPDTRYEWYAVVSDGTSSANQIAGRLSSTLETPVAKPVVLQAWVELRAAGLLDDPSETENEETRPSRREVIQALGAAAGLLTPMVSSIVLPTPAAAASPILCAAAPHGCNAGVSCTTGAPYTDPGLWCVVNTSGSGGIC